MVRRWPRCSGVSRTISTSGRRSFSMTSAARVSRVEVTPVAISLMVRTEQGATIMPSVRNEPEAMEAPTSLSRCVTSARPIRSSADKIGLLRQGQQGGAGHDEMAFDPELAQGVQHAHAVSHAGRSGNSDDQSVGRGAGFRTAPFTSSANSGSRVVRVRTVGGSPECDSTAGQTGR